MTSVLRRQWIFLAAALSLLLGLASFAGSTGISAQGLSGAPVDIHEGSCDDYLTEPAYDAGDTEPQSLNELRDGDNFDDDGLTEDGNTLGVDVNNDGSLDDSEIIGSTGDDTQVSVADAGVDGGIAEDGNWVVVVHSSPDAYDTALACGSLNDAQEADDGDMVVKLQPVDNSGYFGYSVVNGDRTNVTTYVFEQGAAPQGDTGTTPTTSAGYPIDIHEGTCTDWTLEPAYDGGDMQVTNVGADGEQEVGDTEAELPEAANALGEIHHVDNAADFTANELRDEGQYVVAVHESEDNYETLVACGPILDIPEDDSTVVPLMPVGDSDKTGVALLASEGDGELTAFLWDCEPLEQVEFPTPTPTPEPTNTPTPIPTTVVEVTEEVPATEVVESTEVITETEVIEVTEEVPATEIIEVTEVVTETEVIEVTEEVASTEIVESTEVITETQEVLAPTATAMAGGESAASGQEPETIELGDESPGEITTQAGQSFILENTSDNDRTLNIPDLGIEEETIAAGEELEVIIPDDVEAGSYPYEILEDGETLFEDEVTVE